MAQEREHPQPTPAPNDRAAEHQRAYAAAQRAVRDPDRAADAIAEWIHTPPPQPAEETKRITTPPTFRPYGKPKEWIIDGLLPVGEITDISAQGGAGKSRLVLQATAALSLSLIHI